MDKINAIDGIPPLTDADHKLLDEIAKLSPQDRIDRIKRYISGRRE